MKQFFKFVFASMLGFMLAGFLLFFLLVGLLIGSLSSAFSKQEVFVVRPGTVLHLTLDQEIVDRGSDDRFAAFDPFSLQSTQATGLNDLLGNITRAKDDPNISGIFLDLGFLNTGWSTIDELRQKLLDFKESGKFIIAYGEVFNQAAYYLATVADEVYVHPEGMIELVGLNSEIMFFKNTLDKLGIEAQIIRHGQFKSAGEPFFLEKMSNENREQIESFMGSIWGNVVADIAESRGIAPDDLIVLIDQFAARNPPLAIKNGLIDGMLHRDEVLEKIKEKLGFEKASDIILATLTNYKNSPSRGKPVREKIAIVYGTGVIIPGKGGESVMGSATIAQALKEARTDNMVKAIVFRINSPGGSALASDVILRELELARAAKPVVVSFGDVAASGGYYVACKADYIIANPNSITGSIGVFGVIPNMKSFFNQKLGITFDNVKTNELADFGSINRPLTSRERAIIQEEVARIYNTFITHVAKGREMSAIDVDKIGGGRVWSGAEALEIGLVDELGGLELAIDVAAEKAKLENYRLVELPVQRTFLQRIIDDWGQTQERHLKSNLGQAYHYLKKLENVNQSVGILMRMPFDVKIE